MKYKDISGQKFGQLTALYKLHNYHKTGSYWLCVCECGNFKEVYLGSLQQGLTISCGCYHKKRIKEVCATHGKHGTRIYKIWKDMKQRCYNTNNLSYKEWGGRGILICDEWLYDFMTFYDWSMNNGYKDNLTIDRIDNNKGYSPSNCRWTNAKTQSRNKRNNINITINGEVHCLTDWCKILNLNHKTVSTRLSRGWSIARALNLGKVRDISVKRG